MNPELLSSIQVVPRIADESSGPSQSVPALARALAASGVPTSLLTLEPNPSTDPGVPHRAFATLGVPGAYRFGFSTEMCSALRAIRDRGALVHNHSLWMMPNIASSLCPPIWVRRVCSPRGALEPWSLERSALLKKMVWYAGQRAALERVHLFHATSDSECASIRNLGFRQPIALIPNGVDIPSSTDLADADRQMTVVFLSRIDAKKRVLELLDIWDEVFSRHGSWTLKIAGPLNSVYAKSVAARVRQLEAKNVRLVGELRGMKKLRFLSSADLFVLPTRSENFGMAVAEALACGTPVVTTSGAPWQDVSTVGCGWCSDNTELSFKAALDVALGASREQLAAMGSRGRDWMAQSYSWISAGKDLAEVYRWCLDKSARPSCVLD